MSGNTDKNKRKDKNKNVKIYINDQLDELDLESALPLLSAQRREQVLKFKFEAGRKQSAAAYRLLQTALQQKYGITAAPVFQYEAGGKPYLADHPDIYFNLSHCKEAAVCAVSDAPIGIDVEGIRRYELSLVRYTMSDEEVDIITRSADPPRTFIRYWTMKEALVKLTGKGICTDLKRLLPSPDILLETTECDSYIYTVATYR